MSTVGMLTAVSLTLLFWLSLAVYINDQKIAKKKARQRELMKRSKRVVEAIDRMLSNPAQLSISHFSYSRMHKRMVMELTNMQSLASEVHAPKVIQRQMLMKKLQHETSFSQHMERRLDCHMEPLSIENDGVRFELKVLELHRIARLLSKSGLSNLSEHDALRTEILTIESSATFFKLLQSKTLADSMFMKDMFSDARHAYSRIVDAIEREIPLTHQILARNLMDFCQKRLDTIGLLNSKQNDFSEPSQQVTDGLENYFLTKKKYIPVHSSSLSISNR